jgi:acetoin utilization deacetylase AcuC-like enzyme
MYGHVFQFSEEQMDRLQFKKTLEALQAHIKKSLKYTEELAPLLAASHNGRAGTHHAKRARSKPTGTEDMMCTEQVKQRAA